METVHLWIRLMCFWLFSLSVYLQTWSHPPSHDSPHTPAYCKSSNTNQTDCFPASCFAAAAATDEVLRGHITIWWEPGRRIASTNLYSPPWSSSTSLTPAALRIHGGFRASAASESGTKLEVSVSHSVDAEWLSSWRGGGGGGGTLLVLLSHPSAAYSTFKK